MYYVYIYRDPITYKIFYIGKGKNNRMYSHWNRKDIHYNLILREKLQAISKFGLVPIIEKYKDNLENYEAFYLEFKLIKKYGRIDLDPNGILCNRSIGFEYFNIRDFSLPEIKKYLNDNRHFNSIYISNYEKNEICSLYLTGSSLIFLSKNYSHSPHTIKKVLLESNIKIRSRGGQYGKGNGMYGVKRENNAHFKGKKHTSYSKQKISNSLKGKTCKKLKINDLEFSSIREACEYINIPRQTLTRYAKLNKILIKNEKEYAIKYI